ncbi:MAG: PilZ domain-containing protein [Breznakiellaceae bacterium]
MWILLLFLILLGGALVVLFLSARKGPNYSWVEFFARGKDAGFSFAEINLLRRLALMVKLEDPTSLFWSEGQLDMCIREYLRRIQMTGEETKEETQKFLSKLYEYRKKVALEHPKVKKGLSSTRYIEVLQPLKVLVDGVGVYASKVIGNSSKYLSIERPAVPLRKGITDWKGRRLAIYFWRKDDAGYVFDTYVLNEVLMKGTYCLQVAHSDSLFRTQKRRSVRLRTHKPAYLYFLQEGDESPEKVETAPGLKCILQDLSDTGYAVVVGGKGKPEMKIKVQFEVNGEPLVMPGVVRSVDYNEEKNRSVLHVEAFPLSVLTRNRILAAVFGVIPETDYETIFRESSSETEDSALLKEEGGRSDEVKQSVEQ